MTQSTGVEFERSVAEAIKKLNYKVTTEPLNGPEYSSWRGSHFLLADGTLVYLS